MKNANCCFLAFLLISISCTVTAQSLPLKRAVELALTHSSSAIRAGEDEQRAEDSYRQALDQYLPQMLVGSGLGDTWGYPLTLEGFAPSIVNINAQSALLNLSLRDYIHAAKTEMRTTALQSKDQRQQVIQETVVAYAELSKWEMSLMHLTEEYANSLKAEEAVNRRIQEGVDSPVARTQARLTTARVYLRISQAQGGIDLLRDRLAQLTGLAATSIHTEPDSIPALPEIKQDDDLVSEALRTNPTIAAADTHAIALGLRAHAEHHAIWPTVDFATQYAVLARFNNWLQFFPKQNFQENNATVGVVIRFPFFSPAQRAAARTADADAVLARQDAQTARNQVSQETLKLQRSVEQLSAAQQITELEYEIAKANFNAVKIRADAATATLHDVEDARAQADARFDGLQDANFELERARINLLRSTGQLESWLGLSVGTSPNHP